MAQINGGQPEPRPTPVLQRSNTVPKRRADDDLRGDVSKTPRTNTPVPKTSLPPQPIRPLSSQRPTNGLASRPNATPLKRPNDANKVVKPTGPARPAPASSNGALAARPAPKKGSFAEIMARGQRAQTVMGQVGKIQHKKVEKGSGMKRKEDARAGPKSHDKRPSGHPGATKTGKPTNGNGAQNGNRNGAGVRPTPNGTKKPGSAKQAAEEEKKVKKAVQATTGYTGTARPRPGAAAKKDKNPRGGALLAHPPPRPSSSKRSRVEDDYDEELEDFIDYDDEEDEGGPRYDYASDGSSDMEAGLSDIDDEERRAEQIARREDVEEARLEMSLKAAKEERKRKALEALRAGRR